MFREPTGPRYAQGTIPSQTGNGDVSALAGRLAGAASPQNGDGNTMAVRGTRGAQRTRTDAERARLYAARRQWNEKQGSRRRRDTLVAVIAGGLIVIGAVVSQTVHAQVTAPAPTPTAPAESPTPSSAPSTPAAPAQPTQTPDE